jgi:hypothetical protein
MMLEVVVVFVKDRKNDGNDDNDDDDDAINILNREDDNDKENGMTFPTLSLSLFFSNQSTHNDVVHPIIKYEKRILSTRYYE